MNTLPPETDWFSQRIFAESPNNNKFIEITGEVKQELAQKLAEAKEHNVQFSTQEWVDSIKEEAYEEMRGRIKYVAKLLPDVDCCRTSIETLLESDLLKPTKE